MPPAQGGAFALKTFGSALFAGLPLPPSSPAAVWNSISSTSLLSALPLEISIPTESGTISVPVSLAEISIKEVDDAQL